jgi:hypothetical protein
MPNPIKTLVQDFGWIHTGIGLAGNILFFVGSVAFLPRLGKVHVPGAGLVEWQTVGVWLFIFGAAFMAIGSLGALLVKIYEAMESDEEARERDNRSRA